MRRIIERKVTVVTTTTWTISWQADPLHPSPEADPVHPAMSDTGSLPAAQITSPVTEIKEADIAIEEQPVDPHHDPAKDIHPYPSESERK
jgi:hypothetical protein